MYKPISQYASNELNQSNTYSASGLITVDLSPTLRVGIGFYGTPNHGKESPFLALLGKKVGEDWKVLANRDPIWDTFANEFPFFVNGEAGLNQYVQAALDHFNPKVEKFISDNGGAAQLEYWQKVLNKLKSVKWDGQKLTL